MWSMALTSFLDFFLLQETYLQNKKICNFCCNSRPESIAELLEQGWSIAYGPIEYHTIGFPAWKISQKVGWLCPTCQLDKMHDMIKMEDIYSD